MGRFEVWDILYLGRFGAWDVLRLGSFWGLDILYLGRFGAGTFWGLGRFVYWTYWRFEAWTFWGWDLMSLDVLSLDVMSLDFWYIYTRTLWRGVSRVRTSSSSLISQKLNGEQQIIVNKGKAACNCLQDIPKCIYLLYSLDNGGFCICRKSVVKVPCQLTEFISLYSKSVLTVTFTSLLQ
jgi:hypothetical protein